MPSAKNVPDAASRWADTSLLSPGSVFTPTLQSISQDAKRASEPANYLSGVDHLRISCFATRRHACEIPAPRPTKGTLQQTGNAETEDEGRLRAGVQAEGTRKWCRGSKEEQQRQLQGWTEELQKLARSQGENVNGARGRQLPVASIMGQDTRASRPRYSSERPRHHF